MKFSEAMKALEDGKKIRWSKDSYIHCRDGIIYENLNKNIKPMIFTGHEWELYEEPKKTIFNLTFAEALMHMIEGGFCFSEIYPEYVYSFCGSTFCFSHNKRDLEFDHKANFLKEEKSSKWAIWEVPNDEI